MMRGLRAGAGIAGLLALTGCGALQTVGQFTAADAANAAAMAKAQTADAGAATRLSCYQSWTSLAGGLAALPNNSSGIFTAVEAGIEVEGALRHPACQVIAGQVLLWALRKTPGIGGLVP